MSVEINKLENSKVELKFKISKEAFAKAVDNAFLENSHKFNVPGFRNGKVPRNVIEKTYGESVMYDDAFSTIASLEYEKAIEDNKLNIVSHPEINVQQMGKDKDLEYTITVYVKPENITISKYKGIEVSKIDVSVTDEDVEKELHSIQEKNARMIDKGVDSTVENTDTVTIDFEGLLDNVPFDGGRAEKYELEIGSHSFIAGFEEQLIGMKIGEGKDINVTFPSDYGAENLAGKPVVFKIKLHDIKKKELPELNDDFAKDVSEFNTLEEYKKSVKENLIKTKETNAKSQLEYNVVEQLVNNVEVEIPQPMIEHQVEHLKGDFEQKLTYQGADLKKYLEIVGETEEQFLKSLEEPAIRDIKLKLAMEEISKLENITITEDEIKVKIEELVKQYNKNASEFENNENVKEYIKQNLIQEKIFDILTSTAIQK